MTAAKHWPVRSCLLLMQPLVTTGSEYLLADLGCGVAGVFSLATGQLMRELRLHSMQAAVGGTGAAAAAGTGAVLCGMEWVQVTGGSGSSRGAGGSSSDAVGTGRLKRTLLAAACVGGQHVSLAQLDVEGAAQQVREQGRQVHIQQQQQQQRPQPLMQLQGQQQQQQAAQPAAALQGPLPSRGQQHAAPQVLQAAGGSQQGHHRASRRGSVWFAESQKQQLSLVEGRGDMTMSMHACHEQAMGNTSNATQ